ncbi:MAG: hypothetical protein JZU47_09880 [Prolixibacteraceae bacterium]|jgi:hypothetical protein|nr:hypothetical protein [Prolixibacteraceae bacterium]
MKNFFSTIWKYIAFLFGGIVLGMVAAIKLIAKPSVLNVMSDTFIAAQTQRIGKLKQKGEGNLLDTSASPKAPNRKERRIARRTERRERRHMKASEPEEPGHRIS